MSTRITTKDIEKHYGPLTFGNVLKSYRLAEDWTQVELAKKLRLSKQAVNDIENGRKIPSIRRVIGIAKKVGILPDLAVQLILQDQIRKEKLKFTVRVTSDKSDKVA